ncbi:MAG TPA: hypothetical protein VK041_04545 [Opitutales bacterium]|nr:hypothetical protein [Opitutales bacterium]
MSLKLDIVILGLSITSSWGNGHATTYRGLVRELINRGHQVTFLERDLPWYVANRDLSKSDFGRTYLYQDLDELRDRFGATVSDADVVVIGSYVTDGIEIAEWALARARGVKAFYDIDTPVTFAQLRQKRCNYLSAELIPRFDLYFSFTGGPVLNELEENFGSPAARPLYCSVDPEKYFPEKRVRDLDLGYMGTYSPDRQPALEKLLLKPARRWRQGRFEVVGPQYPADTRWPLNVFRVEHLPPDSHRVFYNRQRFNSQSHSLRYDPRRIFSERPAFRSGRMRYSDYQRLVERSRYFL